MSQLGHLVVVLAAIAFVPRAGRGQETPATILAERMPPLDSLERQVVLGAIAEATALRVRVSSALELRRERDGRSFAMLRDACNAPGGKDRPPAGDDCFRLALGLHQAGERTAVGSLFLRACVLGNLIGCEFALLNVENPALIEAPTSSEYLAACVAGAPEGCAQAEVEAVARLSASPLRRRQVADLLLEYGFQESERWTASTMLGALRVLAAAQGDSRDRKRVRSTVMPGDARPRDCSGNPLVRRGEKEELVTPLPPC